MKLPPRAERRRISGATLPFVQKVTGRDFRGARESSDKKLPSEGKNLCGGGGAAFCGPL